MTSTESPNQYLLPTVPPQIRALPSGLHKALEEYAFAASQADILKYLLDGAKHAMKTKAKETKAKRCCSSRFRNPGCRLLLHLPAQSVDRVWYFFFDIGGKGIAVDKANAVVMKRVMHIAQCICNIKTAKRLPLEILEMIGNAWAHEDGQCGLRLLRASTGNQQAPAHECDFERPAMACSNCAPFGTTNRRALFGLDGISARTDSDELDVLYIPHPSAGSGIPHPKTTPSGYVGLLELEVLETEDPGADEIGNEGSDVVHVIKTDMYEKGVDVHHGKD